MDLEKLRASMTRGNVARLVPVVADSKKEERATSVVLAAFMVVPDFAQVVLSEAGAPIGKRSKIQCFTEVSFKGDSENSRPDGLIIVSSGTKLWSAIVESKVGRADLSSKQVESYLAMAKAQGIDAVITISNQFAPLPTHHPVSVNKQKLRSTSLYHFSWLSILSKALLLIDGKSVQDVEQAYILKEVVRYLEHDYSGVAGGLMMSDGWKEVCSDVHEGAPLVKSKRCVNEAVSSWHQLQRFLSIQLSKAVGKPVTSLLSRKHSADPVSRMNDDVATLVEKHVLHAGLDVPNAAGRIEIKADFLRRTLDLSMSLEAPKDVKRQAASVNWLVRQLRSCKTDSLLVRANWPRRIPVTSGSAEAVLENIDAIMPPNVKDLPTSFELVRVMDLGAKFKSVKKFVELSDAALISFYSDVGQNMVRWVPKAPKVKRSTKESGNVDSRKDGDQFLSSLLDINANGIESRREQVATESDQQPVARSSVSFSENAEVDDQF